MQYNHHGGVIQSANIQYLVTPEDYMCNLKLLNRSNGDKKNIEIHSKRMGSVIIILSVPLKTSIFENYWHKSAIHVKETVVK